MKRISLAIVLLISSAAWGQTFHITKRTTTFTQVGYPVSHFVLETDKIRVEADCKFRSGVWRFLPPAQQTNKDGHLAEEVSNVIGCPELEAAPLGTAVSFTRHGMRLVHDDPLSDDLETFVRETLFVVSEAKKP